MLALAASGASEGLWLRAERQTAGRGRQGRVWQSPPGNLYASTLVRLRPGDPPAPGLALVAGVALDEAVRVHAPDAAMLLKWPNDLLIGDAKVAGILLERAGDAVVAGFGVNLGAAPDIAGRATTRFGHALDPGAVLETLAAAFARWIAIWRDGGIAPVRARWIDRAHPIGTPLRVQLPGEPPVDGLYDGLEADGALRLRAVGGTLIVRAGDVLLL